MDYGAIDIACYPFTERELSERRVGGDDVFLDKVRVSPTLRSGGVSMAEYVSRMVAAGVERALLIASRTGDLRVQHSHATPYERIAEYCEAFPGRFHGVAGIDPSRTMAGLRELESGVRDYGFVAAHLLPQWFEWAPDHRKYYPFYAKCCELDIPIMMQMGQCLDYLRDRILPSVGRPMTLDQVAIDFPELRIVGTHLGWPWTDELIAICYKHANVYMSGDAHAPKYWPASYVHFINSWGQDKVMFGLNWPLVSPERGMEEIAAFNLRPEAQRKFLRDNALRVFKLPAEPVESPAPPAGEGS
jgi:predicted TIM-barrel fold metal-dependent hydrolase